MHWLRSAFGASPAPQGVHWEAFKEATEPDANAGWSSLDVCWKSWKLTALRPGNLDRTNRGFEPSKTSKGKVAAAIHLESKPTEVPKKVAFRRLNYSSRLIILWWIITVYSCILPLGSSCDFQQLATCLEHTAHKYSSWHEVWCPMDMACSCCDLL